MQAAATVILFLVSIVTKPLLTCRRPPAACKKEKIMLLKTLPIENYSMIYQERIRTWPKPTPVTADQQEVLNGSSQECTICGSVANDPISAIIEGQNVSEKQFPWQVYIRGQRHYCGGVLISSQWVLTAAHCISNTVYILLGITNIATTSPHKQVRRALKEIVHEHYNDYYNDIALIKMNTPVVFNDYVRPICLPQNYASFLDVQECYLTGWGLINVKPPIQPNILQQQKLKVMPNDMCKFKWRKANIIISPSHLCTEQYSSKSGGCLGDSGSPLSCLVNGYFYVAGIINAVQNNCIKTTLPDMYARASYFREWIKKKLLENS